MAAQVESRWHTPRVSAGYLTILRTGAEGVGGFLRHLLQCRMLQKCLGVTLLMDAQWRSSMMKVKHRGLQCMAPGRYSALPSRYVGFVCSLGQVGGTSGYFCWQLGRCSSFKKWRGCVHQSQTLRSGLRDTHFGKRYIMSEKNKTSLSQFVE